VLKNHPELLRSTERWNAQMPLTGTESGEETKTEPYFLQLLREKGQQMTKFAPNSNQMSGLSLSRRPANFQLPKDWVRPTQELKMTIDEWWHHAKHLEDGLARNASTVTESDHYYYTLQPNRKITHFYTMNCPYFAQMWDPTYS
jgi:hypothetical protein